MRELTRRVHGDACIELDTNRYSAPWKLISESVAIVVSERQIGSSIPARRSPAMRRTSAGDYRDERTHLAGIVGANLVGVSWLARPPTGGSPATLPLAMPPKLLRPLAKYGSALGGRG